LNISDSRRYFDSAAATGGAGAAREAPGAAQASFSAARDALLSGAAAAELPPQLALRALQDALSASGDAGLAPRRTAGFFGGGEGADVPACAERVFREEASAADDLLCHYWASQPAVSGREMPARAAKRLRIRTALAESYDRLQAAKDGLAPDARHVAGRRLQPLLAAMDASFDNDTRAGWGRVEPAAGSALAPMGVD
jgi:hypothetical protein